MRFSIVHCITLVVFGLTRAQYCGGNLVDFENLTEATSLGALQPEALIPNGYGGLNWVNVAGVTVNAAAQNILPQGKNFAAVAGLGNPPSTTVVISALPGRTFSPKAIFLATTQYSQLGGVGTLSTAGTIFINATFKDGHTSQTIFNFKPPFTVFGPNVNAEALQYFQFPCEWAKVVSLNFSPQAEDGLNILLGMVMDNFYYNDDTAA